MQVIVKCIWCLLKIRKRRVFLSPAFRTVCERTGKTQVKVLNNRPFREYLSIDGVFRARYDRRVSSLFYAVSTAEAGVGRIGRTRFAHQ